MSTRSSRLRPNAKDASPPRTRKGVSPPRSPARSRKTSPPKTSPARKSSPPARSTRKSPSRKSPSRKPASKFPARKSPSRTTKETTEAVPKSPNKRSILRTDKDVAVKLEDLSAKLDIYRGTRSKLKEYSIKDISSTDITGIEKINGLDSHDDYGLRNRKSSEELPPRRSSRLKEFIDSVPDIRRSLSKSVSKSISKSISQSLDAYSDEENSEEDMVRQITKPVTRKLATPLRGSESKLIQMSSRWEFGGRIGSAILTLMIPLTAISILISCSKACTIKSLYDLNVYKNLHLWFSLPASVFIASQYVTQAVFALMPICGTKADRLDETGTKYCFNAFFSSILTVNGLFILEFFGVIKLESLLHNYVQMAVVSYFFALILSMILYWKSKKLISDELNLYGSTGYGYYDFFMGREIHPFISNLDIKVWVSRISNITALILAVLIFKQSIYFNTAEMEELNLSSLKDVLTTVQYKPTLFTFSLMQLIYILNFIMKEHQVTTTFFWQSEGVGYLQTVSSALYPFYFTTVSKFVADTQLSLSTNILITASVLFVLGFFIMLLSNNIKHKLRTNPLDLSMANLDTMPTFHGKKLLVSGLWGFMRHPNYFGDILIHAALALPGILTQKYTAAGPALLTIVVLLHRAWRDHARCQRRYGAAWSRYCKRVPSLIIPNVL